MSDLVCSIRAARTTFDGITGQRERRAGETDDRHAGRHAGPRLPHGFHHEVQRLDAFQFAHAIDIAGRAHGIMDHRPFAVRELQIKTHRLQNGQQIGENDRRIDADAIDRGDHHLGAQAPDSCTVRGTWSLLALRDTRPCSDPPDASARWACAPLARGGRRCMNRLSCHGSAARLLGRGATLRGR